MGPLLAIALVLAGSPQHRRFLQPNLSAGTVVFGVVETRVLATVPILPGEAHPTGYLGKIWVKPAYDGGTFGEAVFADGGQMSGYAEGAATAVGPSYSTYGSQGFRTFLDMTDTSKVSVSDPAVLNLTGGDYTICILGWASSVSGHIPGFYEFNTHTTGVPHDNYSEVTGGEFLCDDATNGAGPGAITSSSGVYRPVDGMSLACCSRTGGTLRAFANQASSSGTLTAASSGACTGCDPFVVGGLSSAGNSMRGEVPTVHFWQVGMTAAEMECLMLKAAGATCDLKNVGPGYVIGEDKIADAGIVAMLGIGFPHTDPLKGLRAFQGYNNWWAVNAIGLNGDTATNGATITNAVDAGPLSRYVLSGADVSQLSGAGNAGSRGLAMATGADGGWADNWADLTMIAKCGTTCAARICSIPTSGVLDAGSLCCDVTLTSNWQRVPANGCPVRIGNDSVVKPEIQLQDGGTIFVAHRQASATGYPDAIRLTNAPVGDWYGQFDAGSFPIGDHNGRVRVVGQTLYNSIDMGPDKTLAKGLGYYFFDAYSNTLSHNAMGWSTVTGSPPTDGGTLGDSAFASLMYGASSTFENKFIASPIEFTAGQPVGFEISWLVSNGTLPDGGIGIGCRATTKLDNCPSNTSCPFSHVINTNTGALGTCTAGADGIITGSRGSPPGSSVTSGYTYGWEFSR